MLKFQRGTMVLRFEALLQYMQLYFDSLGITKDDLQQLIVYPGMRASSWSEADLGWACFIAFWIMAQRKYRLSNVDTPNWISISSAIMMFSHQSCTLPRDKVFGLLALTKSRLRVDYQMPLIELYLRVLIEGCLELEQRPLDPNGKEIPLPGAVYPFMAHLMIALGFSASTPAVRFVTVEAFRLWGALPQPKLESEMERVFSAFAGKRYSKNVVTWRVIPWMLCRYSTTMLRLARCRRRHLLRSFDQCERKTYAAWKQMVKDVLLDVQTNHSSSS